MRNKLRKLAREEKELASEIAQSESKENELENELDRKQELLRQLHDKSEELNAKLDSFLTKREHKMNELLSLQTRAKWYRSIKVKKYRYVQLVKYIRTPIFSSLRERVVKGEHFF